jgi:hypothetical protein
MTRTATESALSPDEFTTGQEVTHEDIIEVIENLAYVGSNSNQVIASVTSGSYQWGGSEEVATHDISYRVTAKTEYYRFWHYISDDIITLKVSAEMDIPAAHTCLLTMDIGAATPDTGSTSFTIADVGAARTFNITQTKTGWQQCYLSLEYTTGSTTNFELISWTLAEIPITPLTTLVDE